MSAAPLALRVLSLTSGDAARTPMLHIKYGAFLEALGRRVQLTRPVDTSLTGWPRLWGALRTFHPNRRRWRERFYQHPAIFRARSQQLAHHLRQWRGRVDVVLQLSTLFDASWDSAAPPVVQYCDYTARMAAQDHFDVRSPFSARERAALFEMETRSYQRAAFIFTWSRRVQASLVVDYGLPPERVMAIGAGVGLDPLPSLPLAPAAAPTALFIGGEFLRKGGDVLLQAFALARRAVPDARLEVITLEPIPAGLPLDGVTVHPARKDRELVLNRLRAVDLLVLPSRLETWGDVLLEAMAHGLPCIGIAGLSMDEIIVPESTGLLVPPEDPPALAAALVRVLADRDLGRRWGLAGRQRLEQLYTWPRVIELMLPHLLQAARGAEAGA